jgi:class 3 adenylate cyclase
LRWSGEAAKLPTLLDMPMKQQFHSLEDFLASAMSHIDGVLDDGWGFGFPVKGREIEATVLFADISGFSTRTLAMSPAATLVYVQNFFAWVTAEALQGRPGIVDKYIGDEVMVVFSKEFGSEDPFADAVQAAAAMSRHDVHAYGPHIGIASGRVIVGYAGTALRYNVSVFGAPVALAARCAAVKPADADKMVSSTIVMPASDWRGRDLDDVLPQQLIEHSDGSKVPEPRRFELLEERAVSMKGLGEVAVREIHNTGMWLPTYSAENRALDGLHALHANNRYWPRWEVPGPSAGEFSHIERLNLDPAT